MGTPKGVKESPVGAIEKGIKLQHLNLIVRREPGGTDVVS